MITNKDIKRIIDLFGTPAFIFDEDELVSRVNSIRGILGDISLCYSIKANPFLIPAIMPHVDFLEVCSPGELAICKALSVPPEKIIYSGVHKEHDDIADAVSYGVAILTAESLRHYELICDAAKNMKNPVRVLPRLTAGSQFGMSEEDIDKILNDRDPNVAIVGIHYFAGTGRRKLSKHQEELQMLVDLLKRLKDRFDVTGPMLEYGPGLPFPYFTDEDMSDTLLPLKELASALNETANSCTLSVEMGRFIASSCGTYITSICDIKRSCDNTWCIVDGGINHVNYLGNMMGMKNPSYVHLRYDGETADGEGTACSVCGSLCTTNDVLMRSVSLKDPGIGDVLAFKNIGAYSVTEAPGLFLSRTLPRIVMWHDGKAELVRDHVESWKINLQDKI